MPATREAREAIVGGLLPAPAWQKDAEWLAIRYCKWQNRYRIQRFLFFRMATEVTLDDYERFLAGSAGAETHARVSDALNDANSDLSVFIQGIRDNQSSLLRNSLEAVKNDAADQDPDGGSSV